MLKVGILTSGGDCQALNATMRGVVKGLASAVDDLKIYGFQDGYKGLMYGDYREMTSSDFSGILNIGGTILGTSRQPFKSMNDLDEDGRNKVELMKETYHKIGLDALAILGGNGTQKTANLLSQEGLNIVHLPKTIDNDLYMTDKTFGFESAVEVATNTIDQIHTTAASHKRVFIIEIMGHKVGHIALAAGIAGGADVILLPEIPYDIEKVCDIIKKREASGKYFTIIAVAEGAISKEDAALPKKEYRKKLEESTHPSISYALKHQIEKRYEGEVRIAIPGHTQRGGAPCAADRVLSTRFGTKAAELILKKEFGYTVSLIHNDIVKVPLKDVAGKLKFVEPNSDLVRAAKMVGISFAD